MPSKKYKEYLYVSSIMYIKTCIKYVIFMFVSFLVLRLILQKRENLTLL